jgi:hypothetical protein
VDFAKQRVGVRLVRWGGGGGREIMREGGGPEEVSELGGGRGGEVKEEMRAYVCACRRRGR